jgi:hypothetical protein
VCFYRPRSETKQDAPCGIPLQILTLAQFDEDQKCTMLLNADGDVCGALATQHAVLPAAAPSAGAGAGSGSASSARSAKAPSGKHAKLCEKMDAEFEDVVDEFDFSSSFKLAKKVAENAKPGSSEQFGGWVEQRPLFLFVLSCCRVD